jgi:RHS repeat-associated protein
LISSFNQLKQVVLRRPVESGLHAAVAVVHEAGLEVAVVERLLERILLTRPTFGWILFWDYRGAPSYGLFTDGTWAKPHTLAPGQSSCPLVGPNRCVVFQWPLAQSAWDRNRGKVAFPAWHGTLVESKRDGSGLEYARNRVYDPATGRFTQDDPIGLAGGLNLYGFANSDPVNVSDPFGLLTCPPLCSESAEPGYVGSDPGSSIHCCSSLAASLGASAPYS